MSSSSSSSDESSSVNNANDNNNPDNTTSNNNNPDNSSDDDEEPEDVVSPNAAVSTPSPTAGKLAAHNEDDDDEEEEEDDDDDEDDEGNGNDNDNDEEDEDEDAGADDGGAIKSPQLDDTNSSSHSNEEEEAIPPHQEAISPLQQQQKHTDDEPGNDDDGDGKNVKVDQPAKTVATSDSGEDSDDGSEAKANDEHKTDSSGDDKPTKAQFTLGDDGSDNGGDDSSDSAPSERQPEPSSSGVGDKKRLVLSSSESDKNDDDDDDDAHSSDGSARVKETAALGDIDLSSDSSNDEQQKQKDFTEDDIVGPRLYPDPETQDDDDRPEPTIVEVNTARICPNIQEDGFYFVKFPNFLSIEPRPFDYEHYEDEFDEDELMDEEGRARLKLRVENTIRWRYAFDDAGNIVKLGNSKIVRWSDGTMSLYLGHEAFDIQVQPMQHDNHLFMRQGAGLQGHAVFKEKLSFRPISTDSITHRKVTLSMADRSNKSQKVKVLNTVGMDPESQKAKLVRAEEERLRAQNRREAKLRRNRMRSSVRTGLSINFLEEREDESDADESISAIKKHYKNRFDERPLVGHSDSDDSDSRRLHDAKKDSDQSDSDKELKKQKKRKVIIDDDEED